MKRVIRKVNCSVKCELEKSIWYLVIRRSGVRLNKDEFNAISTHFVDSGGHMDGIKDDGAEKQEHYLKLNNAIDRVLSKQ